MLLIVYITLCWFTTAGGGGGIHSFTILLYLSKLQIDSMYVGQHADGGVTVVCYINIRMCKDTRQTALTEKLHEYNYDM